MAGDWIKVQTCTPDKPEIHRMAELLSIDPDAVLGKLIRIWAWADQQTIDGNAASVTRSLLDRLASVTGFTNALADVGWIEPTETGWHFTNFERHNGKTAKTRALGGKRVKNHRAGNAVETELSRQCNGVSVTEALPEKRREEKRDKTQRGLFQKPSISEVTEHILQQGYCLDAKEFVSYYESNGWKVGRNPMKCWKATLAQWEARRKRAAMDAGEDTTAAANFHLSADWASVKRICRQPGLSPEQRKAALGQEAYDALRAIKGMQAMQDASNDFDFKALAVEFFHARNAIREKSNGTSATH